MALIGHNYERLRPNADSGTNNWLLNVLTTDHYTMVLHDTDVGYLWRTNGNSRTFQFDFDDHDDYEIFNYIDLDNSSNNTINITDDKGSDRIFQLDYNRPIKNDYNDNTNIDLIWRIVKYYLLKNGFKNRLEDAKNNKIDFSTVPLLQ